jgi:glutathione S-transferase
MTMRLHHNPVSHHCRRVTMLIHELGLHVEMKNIDFMKGEHQQPEFMRHNPNAKVPVLEDGGLWLWESNAIMTYLADKAPHNALYPTEAKGRADVNRWLFWESAHFGQACNRLIFERMLKPMMMKQQPDPTLVADGEASFKRFAAVLNGQLEGREYVCGAPSIADFALATALMYREQAGMNTSSFRHIQAWLGRVESRDSWKKTAPKM